MFGDPSMWRFKPYYNWNTFNTSNTHEFDISDIVLNLIITGIPSILMLILNI